MKASMRESERKKLQNNSQIVRTVRSPRKEIQSSEEIGRRLVRANDSHSRASRYRPASLSSLSDISSEPAEVYENVAIHYVDDSNSSGVKAPGRETAAGNSQKSNGNYFESEFRRGSSSSIVDSSSVTAYDEKSERRAGGLRKMLKKGLSEVTSRAARTKSDHEKSNSSVRRSSSATLKKPLSSVDHRVASHQGVYDGSKSSSYMKVYPSWGSSQEMDEDDEDVFEDASNGEKSTESDNDTAVDNETAKETAALKQKVEIMENRIEQLEEELREVAALEIALYSVIPEHARSSHKVHAPARRLSRLYIHACKHWTRNKSATIARNMVSGLILITRTCRNDITRLTFWLSNIVVLREIISQTFGILESVGDGSALESKARSGGKKVPKTSQVFEDWEETSTFTEALEKTESRIFSRIVESVWWQVLFPNMQSQVEELIIQKRNSKSSNTDLSVLGERVFSTELWINAFQTAFQRLCPVRAAGHECGCLPVFAMMVMEQCLARLDVAMFNAILRESASHIPTDPASDPIIDSRVLPIPAGEFNVGSGALLKNAVGNWCRWFEDTIKDNLLKNHDFDSDDDHGVVRHRPKCFRLLNELGDLLLLPKDLLIDNSVRKEVCPSISVDVIKRILCYFTPDEFCPDQVPEEVLESLNDECLAERRFAGESCKSFPYTSSPVQYYLPSAQDVSEKVREVEEKPRLDRNVSTLQKNGYISNVELDGLESPLTSLSAPPSPSTSLRVQLNLQTKSPTAYGGNARYELLREVWFS